MEQGHLTLSVENLSVTFPGDVEFTAVNDVSFSLEKGKTLAIVGESGSGKSLTALALIGLLPKSALAKGYIQLYTGDQSFNLSGIPDKKTWQGIRGQYAGMVFQEPMSSLNPVMTIGKQLRECIQTHQTISKSEAKQLAIDWLDKVQLPAPAKLYDRYPHQLSGGQKQRVMIAMAVCNHPVLLIADEPTTALDVTVQKEIMLLMRELQQEQDMAMIFITHDLALASETADEIMVMYKGQVVEHGEASNILHHPQHVYTQALLACRPDVGNKGKRLPVIADFMEQPGNTTSKQLERVADTLAAETILEVNNLQVWFTEHENWLGKPTFYFKAVNNVSFNLKKGEVLGLVGESGCGKSTLSRSLIGLIPVQQGQILFKGKDLATIPQGEWRQVRRQIQMIFQDPYASLNPRMTIGDILAEPMRVHGLAHGKEIQKEVKRLLDIVHLPEDSYKRYPHQFSGGQRQRIGIARALALKPELLICDESVSALDVSIQAQILNLLKELQSEFQLSYLFISHDLSVVYYISDRVMVMQSGKIVETDTAEKILLSPEEAYTRELIDAMPKIK